MAQDFAKQRNNPDNGKRKRAVSKGAAPSGTANWSWFFSGLMTGVIVSIAAYLAVAKLEEDVVESAQSVADGASPEDQPAYSFGFYEALTNAEVAVDAPAGTAPPEQEAMPATTGPAPQATAPAAVVAQTITTADEQPTLYLLQAGSFQNKEDAESRRARIILLNMNANVVEGVVSGRTRYRVQVGPFAGRKSAEDARDILGGNDIESIPLLVPQ